MRRWIMLALAVVVLDQLTKMAAGYWLDYHQPVPVWPFFNLTLSYNTGAAFSFLAHGSGWQRWFFAALAAGVSVALVMWLRQIGDRDRWLSLSVALILGGAVGNLVDRLAYGHVVDFIQLYYQRWSFPIFNVADSAISLGVAGMMAHMMFVKPEPQKA
jgi:signal peptidase II